MSKKIIIPEIEYPEFFRKIDKNNLPERLYRRGTREINAAFTRRDWFQRCEFMTSLKEATSFLSDDAMIAERLYCFLNDIKERVVSPLSGLPLKWNIQKGRYNTGADLKEVQALRKKPVRREKLWEKEREEFKRRVNEGDFNLIPREELKKFITLFYKDGKMKKQPKISDVAAHYDEFCSIYHYTKKYLPFLTGRKGWSEKMYIVYYDKEEYLDGFLEKYEALPRYNNFFKGFGKKPVFKGKGKKDRNKMLWEETITSQGFEILEEDYYNDANRHTKVRCKKCGRVFTRVLGCGYSANIYCPGCNKEPGVSRLEMRVREEVKKLYNGQVLFNDRSTIGTELDIYLPDKKLAIEINGLLWHSYGTSFPDNTNKESKYKTSHYQKCHMCREKGITLLQFSDNQIYEKLDVVISMIRAHLGNFERRVYARKCEVRHIDAGVKSKFCYDNHLHGDAGSQINYGLFYEDELVSVMTFGKRKITKGKPEMELIRFCSLNGTQVIGGASKLLAAFMREYSPRKVITYSDNMISDGKLYGNLGFVQVRETKFNYWYLTPDEKKLLHRSNFMKHKLNTTLTEREEMYNRGYRRYYDAGHKVFELVRA